MKLIFATGNPHKMKEVQAMLGDVFAIQSLKDMGYHQDIPEPHPTLEENALEKARVIYQEYRVDCFSEDTGLEIDTLDGEPGVRTARYAGEEKSAIANMDKVLLNLKDKRNRAAQFRTVVALIIEGKEYTFEGIARGQICTEKSGTEGFGYDPIFQPQGYSITFAEMDKATKNEISHRGKAIRKLVAFLQNYQSKKIEDTTK